MAMRTANALAIVLARPSVGRRPAIGPIGTCGSRAAAGMARPSRRVVSTCRVAILDIGLRDIDGKELARMLRARAETQGSLLVAVTGYSQEHDRQAALEAGFDHHMAKPANGEQLVGLLKQAAQAARQPGTAARQSKR